MCSLKKGLLCFSALMAACCCLLYAAGQAAADVCSEGTGLPPFLSSGADPNLLLLFDNSGSMLDMAYIDKDTDGVATADTASQCFDESYLLNDTGILDPTKIYTGVYDSAQWYKWHEGIPVWKNQAYTDGEMVYSNGLIFQALTSGTSAGETIYDDSVVKWENILRPSWKANTVYHAQSFVFDTTQQRVWYTAAGGTSSATATSAATDTITWMEITRWQTTKGYSAGDFVLWDDYQIFIAASTGTSNGTYPLDDKGVSWTPYDYHGWRAGLVYKSGNIVTFKGMIFKALTDHTASGADIYADNFATHWSRLDEGYFDPIAETDASTFCTAATGTKHTKAGTACITIQAGVAGTSPDQVTAFAASGNFLNWAMASKFDIQKKILTGGKYDSHAERLISENRGCAGSRFVKQVKLDDNQYLTMSVRGSNAADKVDSSDDTGRLEIFGVTAAGFNDALCQAAVAAFNDPSGVGPAEAAVEDCVGFAATGSVPIDHKIYHKAIQECWYLAKHNTWKPGSDIVNSMLANCPAIYADQSPAGIPSSDPAYSCYGVYDPGLHSQREGYVGRCWETTSAVVSGTCLPKPCSTTCASPPCYFDVSGVTHRCMTDGFEDYCPGTYNISNQKCRLGSDQNAWLDIYQDTATHLTCTPSTTTPTADYWSANLDGAPAVITSPPETGVGDVAEKDAVAKVCIDQAMKDYCGDMSIPEVIDPSDEATTTSDYWNLPATLIEAGLTGQLGQEEPLLVMKGHVQWDIPADQTTDAAGRPDGPRGVLYDVAKDLRIGVMALNDRGSKTECDSITPSASISRYCSGGNKDGARVISQIEEGMYVDVGDVENWAHYIELVSAINDIQGTSWTPLAEAMYTALGYYGQNKVPRLDNTDFYYGTETDSSGQTWPDPVKYWCQDNHVLIITEGASTADINSIVATFAKANGETTETAEAACTDGLNGSPYLDNLTWFGQEATVKGAAANSSNLYSTLIATNKPDPSRAYAKQPITTHIVTTGSLRTDGTGECSPATLMTNAANNGGSTLLSGEDPAQLETNLKAVLSGILGRASAGSAASVISSSRSGEGAVYQAVFWPQVSRGIDIDPLTGKIPDPLTWIGDVHGLFMDSQGRMWDDYSPDATLWSEDSNGDGRFLAAEDLNGNGCLDGDRRVFFYYDEDSKNTKVCFNDSVSLSDPPVCDTAVTGYCGSKNVIPTPATPFTEPVAIKDFNNYLWSANQGLQAIAAGDLTTNRSVSSVNGRWDFSASKRYIFTWNDLDNDGIVDSDGTGGANDEIIPLVDTVDWTAKSPTHHSILDDFKVADTGEMDHLVNWLRGLDTWHEDTNTNQLLDSGEDLNNNGILDYVYRCRRGDCDPANAASNPEWRLGDIIHSTPKLVAEPAEAFHSIYRDSTYARFVKRHRYRRNVVYFGANDGMLHAVNGGFYNEADNKFWKSMTLSSLGALSFSDASGPALGSEMWAYIPYNLQPHLKCLTDPLYGSGDGNSHKYFVDKEPRVFDVQIFTEEAACSDPYAADCVHPGGWGTILVGALSFGGSPITAGTEGTWASTDNRQFISSYFILDITDPERPAKLLGEMTRTTETQAFWWWTTRKYTDLGFSTPMPSAVVMRGDDGSTAWYLVLGNGPTSIKGENTWRGKVAVLPLQLNTTSGVLNKGFRILNQSPSSTDSGVIAVNTTDTTPRFVSDMMTVDFDLEAQSDPTFGALYKSDAVYFGTVDGAGFSGLPGATSWTGGGGVYRLVTRDIDGTTGKQIVTTPGQWEIKKLIDTETPVTGGLSAGWDSANFWIYFGTGRFFATQDKTDSTVQRFFGIKEPLDTSCEMTWGTITGWNSSTHSPATTGAGGARGLVRTDNIQVAESKSFMLSNKSVVFCPSGSTTNIVDKTFCSLAFLDPPLDTIAGIAYYSYEDLRKYIAGESRSSTGTCPQTDTSVGVDGWFRVLQDDRERVIGQSALLGGLLTFTSYQPFDDLCTAEGMSSLYGVHYQTGTAWYENVFGTSSRDNRTVVRDKLSLGMGLAVTPSMHVGGAGTDAKAFIQTSTGEIIEIGQENLPIQPPQSGKASWCDDCE